MKCSESARTSVCPASGLRMSPANFSSSSAAAAAVRAEVPVVKQIGWPVSTSSTKKVWAVLMGRSRLVMAVGPHVPLAEAADAMGIDGQQPALEVARGAADLAQGHLEVQAVGDRAGPEQFVDGHVAGEERQAVGQLEDPLVQGAAVPQPGAAQRRLVDQLQRQARFHALRALSGPAAHQVPGPQAEQLGDQQPDAGQVSHDLVGEELSHAVLDAPWIARDGLGALLGWSGPRWSAQSPGGSDRVFF